MTAKFSASADGTKVNIGNAAEDALQIDSTAKTIKAVAPYTLGSGMDVVAFAAKSTSTHAMAGSAWTTLLYDTEVFDTHSAFNVGTGLFTAPVAGLYQINWSAIFTGTMSRFASAIEQVGSVTQVTKGSDVTVPSASGLTPASAGAALVELAVGDTVKVQGYVVGSGLNYGTTAGTVRFSGFLVKAL